ncbi:MAG: hypothetical protein ACNY01_02060 [Desulfobacteria bacterium]
MFEEYPAIKKRYWGRHFWAQGMDFLMEANAIINLA